MSVDENRERPGEDPKAKRVETRNGCLKIKPFNPIIQIDYCSIYDKVITVNAVRDYTVTVPTFRTLQCACTLHPLAATPQL